LPRGIMLTGHGGLLPTARSTDGKYNADVMAVPGKSTRAPESRNLAPRACLSAPRPYLWSRLIVS
ncbi:MAG: hypothetical protein KC940_24015, partial [Candidatus Omnitrophica bacterium]|nr:hypothetical protein [Candidatus Omnitrophota bacterium]